MENIIVITASSKEAKRHLESTIKKGIDVKALRRFVSSDEYRRLKEIYGEGRAFLWGAIPSVGNLEKYSKLSEMDMVFVYSEGNYVYVCRIALKTKNRELAKWSWGIRKDGQTWELIYFVTNKSKIDLPREKFNDAFGYLTHYVPQGFYFVTQERKERFVNRFGAGDLTRAVSELVQVPLKEKLEKPEPLKKIAIDVGRLEHWDVIGILLELGNLLGYETYSSDPSRKSEILNKTLGEIASLKDIYYSYIPERHLDTVKKVDVIWFSEEFPEYCFEVEHTTGVTAGLLRLYQIRRLEAKFYIIAPSKIISKFQKEVIKDPFYKIKDRYTFKSYSQLEKFYEEAKTYHKIKENFFQH